MTADHHAQHRRAQPDGRRLISRRRMLGLLALGAVAACTPSAEPAAPAPSRTRTASTKNPPTNTPSLTPTPARPEPPRTDPVTPETASPTQEEPTPTPPDSSVYEVGDGEVFPNAKTAATRVVEALLTYPAGAQADAVIRSARDRLGEVAPGLDETQTALALRLVLDTRRQSVAQVVYPQLGGLDPQPETGREPTRSSVMVVVDQHLRGAAGGPVERVRRCVDVRLRLVGGRWRWEGLGDTGGVPVARPDDLPEVAQMVLDHPDIDLPDSARWDIHAGIIDENLLKVMVLMATRAAYRVTSLKSGHPERVFGQDYLSNHTHGRAVDIWSLAGQPVIAQSGRILDPQESAGTPAHAMTEALLENTTVDELGSPWDLDGPPTSSRPRTRSFTNTIHADHLHVAFDA